MGESCNQMRCPDDCSGRGLCHEGRCHCDLGYFGEACAQLLCPNSCSGQVNPQPKPEPALTRTRTLTRTRNPTINPKPEPEPEPPTPNQGRCLPDGSCACYDGYTRFDCSEKRCPFDCAGHPRAHPANDRALNASVPSVAGLEPHGLCVNGSCVCSSGWGGADCSEMVCPGADGLLCAGHGLRDVEP